MTGDLNDERLEGEFGTFRGSPGGDYYMSGGQVQNALKLQRIKLFSRLEEDIFLEHKERDCCTQLISEVELILLDDCFDNTSDISINLCIIFLGTFPKKKTCRLEIRRRLIYPNPNLLNMSHEESCVTHQRIYTISLCTCIRTTHRYRIARASIEFCLHLNISMKALIAIFRTMLPFLDVLPIHFRKDLWKRKQKKSRSNKRSWRRTKTILWNAVD